MQNEIGENNIYDETVDYNRELSIQKAIAILNREEEKKKDSIYRPDIDVRKGVLKIICTIGLVIILHIILHLLGISLIFGSVLASGIIVFNAKKFAIWMVLVYQKYAPAHVRNACVFTPSCSEYMILAINKYGLILGVVKGVKRLLRCHSPNGGVDNP